MIAIGGCFVTALATPGIRNDVAQKPELVNAYFAICSLFCGLASVWSKSAFAITLLRLTDGTSQCRYFLWFVLVTVNAAHIVFIIGPWIRWNTSVSSSLFIGIVGTWEVIRLAIKTDLMKHKQQRTRQLRTSLSLWFRGSYSGEVY